MNPINYDCVSKSTENIHPHREKAKKIGDREVIAQNISLENELLCKVTSTVLYFDTCWQSPGLQYLLNSHFVASAVPSWCLLSLTGSLFCSFDSINFERVIVIIYLFRHFSQLLLWMNCGHLSGRKFAYTCRRWRRVFHNTM